MNINAFKIMDIAASGMTAERFRSEVISNNLANANTTRTENGGPYRRKVVTFKEVLNKELSKKDEQISGVRVSKLEEDNSPFRLVYDPGHPDADENGYVKYPNVNPLREMVDLITAQRAYEANVAVINSAKTMFNSALSIGRGA
ncbi:flagellar basal-body rod protein FlgC [Marinitoga hydrogenitolerans DSM 16785]|uniref:Flagellar basal-body rod protein FlgC n=1 Tax=Marinitoga hydrogenitolerans (strain DSM 16785 / JCM 12826 / AT1271) TaxID=1122195 RepID=A0A1M4UXR4_MARH1|nr:flagellar basal body rod protein FlgC [Marinitoga hydrogenitolerans]SHE61506.1 flagellar basal-body rod protein FlgC [Marinitoga hydrogenitolerans DSM 16785]